MRCYALHCCMESGIGHFEDVKFSQVDWKEGLEKANPGFWMMLKTCKFKLKRLQKRCCPIRMFTSANHQPLKAAAFSIAKDLAKKGLVTAVLPFAKK